MIWMVTTSHSLVSLAVVSSWICLRERRVVGKEETRGLCWPGGWTGWEMAEWGSVQWSQGRKRVQPSWGNLLPAVKFRHVQLRGTMFVSCIRPKNWLHEREEQDIKDFQNEVVLRSGSLGWGAKNREAPGESRRSLAWSSCSLHKGCNIKGGQYFSLGKAKFG